MTVYFIDMIVLFHTCLIVTRLFLRVISEFAFRKSQKVCEKQETDVSFSLTDDNIICEAKFEPGEGILFFPPVYVQRYTVVKNILEDERWRGKIRKVVDFGCAEFGFFPYMKHVPGLNEVVAVDIDHEVLNHNSCRAAPLNADYLNTRQEPFTVRVLAGSIADRDRRLLGTDAVICIELIEHLYPSTLEAVPYTVFGFIQPLIAIFTTPNSDFNVLFPNLTGFRHHDHKFEWSRFQFEDWATNITTRYPEYNVKFQGIGPGPKGTEVHGCCSQMAVFFKLSHFTPAPIIHPTSPHQDLEAEECEECYVAVTEYKYPFYVDNRTNEEKILHEAEYYIRMLANKEEYWSDMSIQIPLKHIMPYVLVSVSMSELRNILKEANWEIVGQTQDDEAVLYPCDREYENSAHESEDLYYEGNEERVECLQVSDDVEELWDLLPAASIDECGNSATSHLVEDTDSVLLESWSCGITEPKCDVQSRRGEVLELQDVVGSSNDSCESRELQDVVGSSNDSCESRELQDVVGSSNDACKSREGETHAVSDLVKCNGFVIRYESVESTPLRDNMGIENAQGSMQLTSEHLYGFSTNLSSKDDDFQLLTDFVPEPVEHTFMPFVGHTTSEDIFEFSEIEETLVTRHVESSQVLEFEKCSDTEALVNHQSGTHEEGGQFLSVYSYSDDHEVNGEHQNAQPLENQETASHLKTSNINLSSEFSNSSRSIEKLSNVYQSSCTEESVSFELYRHLMQDLADGCMSQTLTSQPPNFGSAGSSVQESSQDRSLVESYSFDEQNEKAGDSGYPNSFSVQDMEMDLTPQQVDELTTESDEIITEDSECYESESSEESDRIDNHDGHMFQFNHEVLYDPMVLVVENGDVANNNRDREGNNAVAINQAPPQALEANDPPDEAFIPLLAAAEDFDNDNDVILPDDDEIFPHWLLHLLDLAHHGVGDVQNYIIPPVGGGPFIMPDEGVGDIDSEDDDYNDNIAASSSSNEMGDNEGTLNDFDSDEFFVPGCSGDRAEPGIYEHGV